MNEFKASNGLIVKRPVTGLPRINIENSDGETSPVVKATVAGYGYLSDIEEEALREFFRAEEDERLDRWRSPENPDFVVYHARNVNGDHKVLNEADGHGMLWGRDMEPAPQASDPLESAARAYFDAHPEPKPWHEAKPGEVWVLTVAGGNELAARASITNETLSFEDVAHITNRLDASDTSIKAGRRIWPESDE